MQLSFLLSLRLVVVLVVLTCQSSVAASEYSSYDLDEYIAAQETYSWQRILDNIHPQGTASGCIVASPSRKDPDYWYEWTRDSAITMKIVVQRYIDGNHDALPLILDYINATSTIQHLHTRSGGYYTGGLGEPKYTVDHGTFDLKWGRPQRDGPALRATVLMAFATEYISRNGNSGRDFVKSLLYAGRLPAHTIIKADLEYVANNWYKPGFDIWEEVYGHHAFTLLVSMRALREGGYFAISMDDPGAAHYYFKQADAIHNSLVQNHIVNNKEYDSNDKDINKNDHYIIRATSFNGLSDDYSSYNRSGLDSSVIIAINQLKSASYITGNSSIIDPWNFTSELIFNTHNAVVKSMRDIYRINKIYDTHDTKTHPALSKPGAIGRYSEDVYDGVATSRGNPWYLTTLAHAEYLYNMYHTFQKRSITISQATTQHYHHFFMPEGRLSYSDNSNRILGNLSLLFSQLVNNNHNHNSIPFKHKKNNHPYITLNVGSDAHNTFLSNIFARADSFVLVVKDFKTANMSLNEQFDGITGNPRGARELTWSHSAFLSMAAARKGNHHL